MNKKVLVGGRAIQQEVKPLCTSMGGTLSADRIQGAPSVRRADANWEWCRYTVRPHVGWPTVNVSVKVKWS